MQNLRASLPIESATAAAISTAFDEGGLCLVPPGCRTLGTSAMRRSGPCSSAFPSWACAAGACRSCQPANNRKQSEYTRPALPVVFCACRSLEKWRQHPILPLRLLRLPSMGLRNPGTAYLPTPPNTRRVSRVPRCLSHFFPRSAGATRPLDIVRKPLRINGLAQVSRCESACQRARRLADGSNRETVGGNSTCRCNPHSSLLPRNAFLARGVSRRVRSRRLKLNWGGFPAGL